MSIIERTLLFSVVKKLCYGSGWVSRRHAAFTPAITRRGSSRAFPLPTVASLPASPSRACALRPRGHTPSAPPTDLWQATNQQKRLDSRLRSPLPSVEEPCPLSLPYGLLDTQPEPLHATHLSMLPKENASSLTKNNLFSTLVMFSFESNLKSGG